MSTENGVLAALHRAELSPSRSCDPVTLRDVDTFIAALTAAGYHIVQRDDLLARAHADRSWHGVNDENDWGKGYWVHPATFIETILPGPPPRHRGCSMTGRNPRA